MTAEQQSEIVKLVKSGAKTNVEVARLFSVHPSTIRRLIAKYS
ncbi:helix-turn-helix domain-containing protein [Marinicella sp. W31]